MTTHLVWLRNDLRVNDNSALYAACHDPNARVIALFIATPGQWQQHHMSPRQATFIGENLQLLQQELICRNIPLYYHQCDDFSASIKYLDAFCEKHRVRRLFYNYQYEFNESQRDRRAEQLLSAKGITVQGFDDSLLCAPGSVLTANQQMYKVFTPFSKTVIRRLARGLPECFPAPDVRTGVASVPMEELSPFDYPRESVDSRLFPAGERAALKQLRAFSQQPATLYSQQRDLPALDGTSRLSVYLASGVLSPRQCLHRLLTEHPDALTGGAAFSWLNELIWREFYRHLMVAWPALCRYQPFIPWTRHIVWQKNDHHLAAWQQGKTGYPIVDAAMRQLNALGWMHNRLRMITASFLVKDLRIDWHAGECYFMSRLIDGDLAANNGGWQWSASTGTDASPWFRIFNPITQGKRFDPDGTFIRQWIPELAQVPGTDIHNPHSWAVKNHKTLSYPLPIVDHAEARKKTLAAFDAARSQST